VKSNITIKEKYGPPMKITNREEALEYFEECIEHSMSFGKTREEAVEIELANLGYYAGYYNDETRIRVEELFGCMHPFFGKAKNGTLSVNKVLKVGENISKKKTINIFKGKEDV